MNNKLLLLCLLLLLASCANTHDLTNCLNSNRAGFLEGFLQGIISPIAFVLSLFEKNITVYEVANNGNWYNLGFVLECYITFKGSNEGAKKITKKRSQ